MKPLIFDGNHADRVTMLWDMQRAGIRLFIHKASEGDYMTDDAYRPRIERAKATGMLTGAYHFGTNDPVKDQVDLFISIVHPGEVLWLDFERYEARPEKQMNSQQAEEFVHMVLDRTGVQIGLYCGEFILEEEAMGHISPSSILRRCPMWISRYADAPPKCIKGGDIVAHQFTGDGVGPLPHRIPGCDNDADLSRWIGNPDDIPRFVAKHSLPGVGNG
ncbi:MAG: glycoside hydrolase family 25 protein [Armatimonadetes bacterium]|nr:glycoside hydrolase family 25 protein [Armatimonadota bacterium]